MTLFQNLFKKKKAIAKEHKLGICLSGGGALGFAHIGVLQALNENGIFPEAISGSSMGAIIGTLYAADFTPSEMLQLIKEDKLYKITNLMNFKPTFWKSGLSDHSTVHSVFEELIPDDSFDSLFIPMHICVSNLNTAEWEIKNSGSDLSKWVAASASIPGVFDPYVHNGITYVDGGLLNNLPIEPLVESCEKVIAVDVLPYSLKNRNLKQKEIVVESIRASLHQNSNKNRDRADYLIEPRAVETYHEFDFEQYLYIYKSGYQSVTQNIIDKIKSEL